MSDLTRVTTPPFRLSFPYIFEKNSFKDSPPKYQITMLFHPDKFTEKDKIAWKRMKKLANKASLSFFQKKLKELPRKYSKPFRKGDEKPDLEGYGEGVIFVVANSKRRPGAIDRKKNDITDPEELYAGCWCRATVTAYGFNFENLNKGVSFGLQNVQKLGEDEEFSGRIAAEDDFDDDADEVWADEDAAPDLDDDDELMEDDEED